MACVDRLRGIIKREMEMNNLIVFLMCLVVSGCVQADEPGLNPVVSDTGTDIVVKIPKAEIKKQLEKYVSSFACIGNIKDIILINEDYFGEFNKEYLVLFYADIGCSRGMGMQSVLAVLGHQSSGNVVVQPQKSFPSVKMYGFPTQITKIYKKNGRLWYSGKEFAVNDANCCPSISWDRPFDEGVISTEYFPKITIHEPSKKRSQYKGDVWFFVDSKFKKAYLAKKQLGSE